MGFDRYFSGAHLAMDLTFGTKYHRWLYFMGLVLIAAGLSVSKVLVSIGTIWIGVNWIWEGNYLAKWRLLLARKSVLLLVSIFVLHVIGLLWSPDLNDGTRDVRIKLPLLVLPFVVGTSSPLNRKQFEALLLLFLAGVLFASIRTMLIATDVIHKKIIDLRQASDLVPLIRLAIFSALSILFLGRWFIRDKRWLTRVGCVLGSLWLVCVMFYMQSLTGLVVLIGSATIIAIFIVVRSGNKKLLLALLGAVGVVLCIGGYSIGKAYNDFYALRGNEMPKLYTHSPTGKPYSHQLNVPIYENGNKVMVNVCWYDLMLEWAKRSEVDFHQGRDRKAGYIPFTIMRYLSSRGLPKDSVGLSKLIDQEIVDIENGTTNYLDKERNPLEKRAYQVFWETYNYFGGGDPSGSSITTRLEVIGAAVHSIKQSPWIGSGTASQSMVYTKYYEGRGSRLNEKYQWMHAHNQFLSFAVTLGIPATLFFLFSLWWPARSMRRWNNYLYLAFFVVTLLSFLDDDTLETQQGVVFYAFFNALFLYAMPFVSSLIPPVVREKTPSEIEAPEQ